MSPADWLAARARAEDNTPPAEQLARPTVYRGTRFLSQLEAGWARTLDHMCIEWEYEQRACKLPSGAGYIPDFWLPALRTFIEAKGTHGQRREKAQELARELGKEIIVLIGWPPARKRSTPYLWEPFINWLDPLSYDTRLALCPACGGWQWMRAQLSRDCRLCGVPHTGLLAKAGEIQFHPAEPDRPSWMRAS